MCIPVLFNILSHFLISLCLNVDAGQLLSYSLLLLQLLFSVYFLLLCLKVKLHFEY